MHVISIYRNALTKRQIFILKLNMSKTKWGCTVEPTITNFFKLITANCEYALKSVDRLRPTAVFNINRSRQKYTLVTSVLGDSYGQPAEIHSKRNK